MQIFFERHFPAILFILGAGASVIVVHFPWFAFMSIILVWTAMRAPKTVGLGHAFNIPAARTLSDAAYEGLWAATSIVLGVTFLFESIAAIN